MSQGARLDLGDLIAAKLLKPKPATLLGVDFEIRRDFTPEQVLAFHALDSEVERARMLVGDAADDLIAKIDPLPLEHRVAVWNRIVRIAGVMPRMASADDDDPEEQAGESSASSQDSPTAGTPSPQTSAAPTASPSRKPSANGQQQS